MTRYENFMAIAHAYYDAYVSQAKCLNKKPLSYDAWLKTDKSEAPGFDGSEDCQKNCKEQCRDANGRFKKDELKDLRKAAEQIEKERGPASYIKPLDEKEDNEEFTVISNGKVLRGDEAKKFLIARGLIKPDNEDSKESDNDGDDDEEYAVLKHTRELFKKAFECCNFKDFL